MEFRQLQYFVKVARKQHVTQAAEELHVAQSAVSRQIHQLEKELGVPLFVQKGRNLQLTPVGKLFLSRAESILSDLERAVSEVHEFMDPEQGEIRIGFPHSLGIHLLPTVVARFRESHPKVKFRLRQGTYNSLIRDVMKGEIDLSFISPLPEKHSHVTGELLLQEELFAIVPQGHALSGQEVIRLEQLKDESFVMFSEEYSLRSIVLEACAQAGFTPHIGFEGEETDTIRGLVAAGMGVSLLPDMALTEISQLQPTKVKITEPTVTRSVGLIRRSGDKLPLVAEGFRSFLLEFFKDREAKRT
ncbi:DNA-binding transcriptional regulator, LysR family [Paenibacillus sp. UNCCL117]|uniref:LysR family transcriptional regulator n=1 Tax=unclassified Paenibacillus TaxID=185978 RepID=UPI00088E5912|nr:MULTISPECIES: LysR family transcriptional regulator [unclassified Paenibacillus]SDC22462.1 DNA-binding transcriptional regulator, LysR family [Paenibacillus sp. cl123]SFW19040.1 DNA-binding transcriptional regulator, LysR family [Paenibacillus sp. UNCCL117]